MSRHVETSSIFSDEEKEFGSPATTVTSLERDTPYTKPSPGASPLAIPNPLPSASPITPNTKRSEAESTPTRSSVARGLDYSSVEVEASLLLPNTGAGGGGGGGVFATVTSLELATDSETEDLHKRTYGLVPSYPTSSTTTMTSLPPDVITHEVVDQISREISMIREAERRFDALTERVQRELNASHAAPTMPTFPPPPPMTTSMTTMGGATLSSSGGGGAYPTQHPTIASSRDPLQIAAASPSKIPLRPTTAAAATAGGGSKVVSGRGVGGMRPRPSTATTTSSSTSKGGMVEKAIALKSKLTTSRRNNQSTVPPPTTASLSSSTRATTHAATVSSSREISHELQELQQRVAAMQTVLSRLETTTTTTSSSTFPPLPSTSLPLLPPDAAAALVIAQSLAASLANLQVRTREQEVAAAAAAAASDATKPIDPRPPQQPPQPQQQQQVSEEALVAAREAGARSVRMELEAQLRDKTKQILSLTKTVNELEALIDPKKRILLSTPLTTMTKAGGGGGAGGKEEVVVLTGDELTSLRNTIREQETLLRGFQMENELAMKQLREQKAAAHAREEELAAAASKWERQAREVQEEVVKWRRVSGVPDEMATMRDSVVGGLRASSEQQQQQQQQQHPTTTAARLEELLRLQSELETTRDLAATREEDLRREIDKLRREKRDLETTAAYASSSRRAEEERALLQVQRELHAAREESKRVLAELEGRLSQYQESMMALEAAQREARQQAATARGYERRVRELEAEAAASAAEAAAVGGGMPLARRIRVLEAEVLRLQDTVREETQRSEASARHERQLQVEVARRQEMIGELEAAVREARAAEAAARVVVAGRGEEEDEVRTRRSESSEGSPTDKKEGGGGGGASPPATRTTSALILARREKRIRELEGLVGLRDQTIADLLKRGGSGATTTTTTTPHAAIASTVTSSLSPSMQMDSLVAIVTELRDQMALVTGRLAPMEDATTTAGGGGEGGGGGGEAHATNATPPPYGTLAQVIALQRRLDAAELSLRTMHRAYSEALERNLASSAEHQRALERLASQHVAAVQFARHQAIAEAEAAWAAKLSAKDKEATDAEQRADAAERSVAALKQLSASWQPDARAFFALEERLGAMERMALEREAQWREVLSDAKRMHSMQQTLEKNRVEAVLAAKNAEISKFQHELNQVIAAASVLRMGGGGGGGIAAA